MKLIRINKLFIFLFFLFLSLSLGVNAKPEEYAKVADINIDKNIIENSKENYFITEMPFNMSKSTKIKDLRIFDINNKEIPFVIESDLNLSRQAFSKIYNQAIIPNEKQILELNLQKNAFKDINEIQLDIEENNFDRKISVYGKNKRDSQWLLIKNDLRIINVNLNDSNIRFNHNTLIIPESNYDFIKIEISLSTKEKPLKINNIVVRNSDQENKTKYYLKDLEFKKIQLKNNNLSKNISYYFIDSKDEDKDYDFNSFVLDFKENDFSRNTSLYCAKTNDINKLQINGENPYLQNLYINDCIYKYNNANNLEITFNKDINDSFMLNTEGFYFPSCPYYILEINNNNDEELNLKKISIKSPKVYLKFNLKDSYKLPLKVYIKSKEKQIPIYDLENKLQNYKIKDFNKTEIINIRNNPLYKEKQIKFIDLENKEYIVKIIIAFLIFGIGIYIFNFVNNQKK